MSLTSPPETRHRLLLLLGVALLAVLAAVGGFFFFQKWRARDLAAKALENYDQADYRMAWLQVNSARELSPDDPQVLRSSAILEASFGLPSAIEHWSRLAAQGGLTAEDLEERARVAARLGTEEQFEQAVVDLEKSGDAAGGAKLRAARRLARGDIDKAIEQTRRMITFSDDPAVKLDLARLLLRRNADELARTRSEQAKQVAAEMIGIVNSLQGTPAAEEALGFGLAFLLPGPEEQERWADLAMQNLKAGNSALLPAAAVLVDLGKTTPAALQQKLRPVFDAAPLDRRAAFAAWLTKQGMPREALSLITVQEAGESIDAFNARIDALAKMQNWLALIETTEAGGNAPEPLRLINKARAEYALGRGPQSGAKSVGAALRAASREGALPVVVSISDEIGAGGPVDLTLVELCGDPRVAAQAFRLARDRFDRRGPAGAVLLATAHQRALAVAPEAIPVQDYARYIKLLAARTVENPKAVVVLAVNPADTAAALAAEPGDPAVRATHALALLRAGRPSEALEAFGDITLSFARLSPGTQTIICASLAASGRSEEARKLVGAIDPQLLGPEEVKLLKGLR